MCPLRMHTEKMDQAKEQDQKRRTKLLDQATKEQQDHKDGPGQGAGQKEMDQTAGPGHQEQQDHNWCLHSSFFNFLVLRSSTVSFFVK